MARGPAGKRPFLDVLVDRFPEYSRDELYRYIMCREVQVDGGAESNPRTPVSPEADIQLVRRRFVSRGGEKLDHALSAWNLSAPDRVWLDAGASTGGFTDCLLQHGARSVHAVDVGYNQLDYRLRRDSRVHVHERTNVGDLVPETLDPRPDAAVCDLSFRSLRGILRSILELTAEGWGIALLKPQFELAAEFRWNDHRGTNLVDAGDGIVDGAERSAVIDRVIRSLREDEGLSVHRWMDSPVTGRGGNREVLLLVGMSAAVGQPRRS